MQSIVLTEEELLRIPNDMELGKYVRHKWFLFEGGMDKCGICGRVSPYPKETHIDNRVGYVEGGGQGCFQPGICNNHL